MLARFGNYSYLCGIALAHERFQHGWGQWATKRRSKLKKQ